MWIGRPAADRGEVQRDVDEIFHLVPNAGEISSTMLHSLLQAQVDLIGKTSREACANPLRRQALAHLVAQQLAILVQEADSVPGKTGESLAKTRLLLDSVQNPASDFGEYELFNAGFVE